MAGIRCCKGCIPPKRYPGCHAVCKEYLAEKAKWEEDKEKIKEQMENIGPTSKHAYDINFMYGNSRRKH